MARSTSIRVRKDLHADPKVVAIATATGDSVYGVVGRLVRVWGWADDHASGDGVYHVTPDWLDAYVGQPGFAQALTAVGWLAASGGGLAFPKLSRHRGRKPPGEAPKPAWPQGLDTPEFRRAWQAWAVYRAEIRKKLTPATVARQLRQLAAWGPARAVASIEQSITKGWQGLFEPREDGSGRSKRQAPGPGQRYDAGRDPHAGHSGAAAGQPGG